jgi:hypothetical protein
LYDALVEGGLRAAVAGTSLSHPRVARSIAFKFPDKGLKPLQGVIARIMRDVKHGQSKDLSSEFHLVQQAGFADARNSCENE